MHGPPTAQGAVEKGREGMELETARMLESWKGQKLHITTVAGERLDCELQDIGPSFLVVIYRGAPMLVNLSAIITMRLFISAAEYDGVEGVTRDL